MDSNIVEFDSIITKKWNGNNFAGQSMKYFIFYKDLMT